MTSERDGDDRLGNAITWLRRARGSLRTPFGIPVVLLAVVWLVLPLLPEQSGLRFGAGYQIFFSAITVSAGLFFWLVGMKPMAEPRGGAAVAVRVALVYVVTVGALVLAGNAYLQFSTPSATAEQQVASGPVEQGEQLFWASAPGCFLCHAIGGRGGQRAPELAGLATRAGTRVPGITAEQYIDGHIREGLNYPYTVPGYAPIMPPFEKLLSDEQIAALIAYLMAIE